MNCTGLDWDEIMRDWSDDDLLYLRAKIDRKLASRPVRRALIVKRD